MEDKLDNNMSEEKLNSTIIKYAVLAGVADVTPVIGADIAAVVGVQLKMFFEIADYYNVTVTKARFMELLPIMASSVGGWGITIIGATKMLKVFPGISSIFLYWQPPVIAAFTWAMGQVFKSYFPLIKNGETWDKKDFETAMKQAWKNAKNIDWKKELKNSFKFG